MIRTFVHALTGRSIVVREGTRTERLVEADKNWSEVKAEKAPAKKAASSKSEK